LHGVALFCMIPDPALPFFDPVFTDAAWPHVALVLRWGVLVLGAVVVFRLVRTPEASGGSGKGGRFPRIFVPLAVVCLVAIAGRQAGWQLFGRRNPQFVEFMQRYDRREFNPAHRVRAGKILDRNGRVLAVSRVTESGVRRFYPYGPVFSHVIGYNHPVYGLSGLESAARERLLGRELRNTRQWAELGRELLDRETYAEGPHLRTTLDLALQRRAWELLGNRRGAVVVLEVESGAVRALVSRPEFDPNRLYSGVFEGRTGEAPLLNRALAGQYPPGSVFKVLVAAAALRANFQGTLDTPPEGFTTSPANPPIRDHEYYSAKRKGQSWRGRGQIDLSEALVHSSNVFFARLGVRIGAEPLERAVQAMGWNQPIPLSRNTEATLLASPARLPDLRDDRPYDIAQFSIGQGEVLVSPLQIAMLCAAVAREGVVVAPRLDAEAPVRPLGRLCSVEEAETLKWMMYKVVQEGTGRGIRIRELPVAGKTGTAQTGGDRPSHSWFAGFTPVSRPQWAFCVLVEHGGYGSSAALPVARELLQTALDRGELSP